MPAIRPRVRTLMIAVVGVGAGFGLAASLFRLGAPPLSYVLASPFVLAALLTLAVTVARPPE